MGTYHIHIRGRVQGVGFRPFVYQLAIAQGINGWVCNATDGVHIRFNADSAHAHDFYQQCLAEKPRLAQISGSDFTNVPEAHFERFEIIRSQQTELKLDIAPDFAMCPACKAEMKDTENRRHGYAFITCTHCGPRYSIESGLPYDRHFTTMASFEMCEECQAEYDDPTDRRYYSQTNSCSTCGVQLSLYHREGEWSKTEAIARVVEALHQEQIVAVKGIGGFLLVCDAHSENTLRELRLWKHRPVKPFAVMYPSIEAIEEHFTLRPIERQALTGPESPIVLLPFQASCNLPIGLIAPDLNELGVMVPYAPLLELIAADFDGPLIATSANLSGSPILHEENESSLLALADWVLTHNRPIHFPQDDSVVRYTTNENRIILRRARGLAPSVSHSHLELASDALAMGAEMKSTFALSANANTYVSSYLGNLSTYENQVQFRKVLDRMVDMVKPDLQQIVVDSHSGYFSHQLGQSWAAEQGVALKEIQHHEAHFAAVLAENALQETDQSVLGVVWDGTGFGTDGQIWGGEFFEYTDHTISRVAHLKYFANMANDRMARDNRLCALALSGPRHAHRLETSFTDKEWGYYSQVLQRPEQYSSSMGRLFDAIAFLSGLSRLNNYEGQAAMLLEEQAKRVLQHTDHIKAYPVSLVGDEIWLDQMFDEVYEDRGSRESVIGARFHLTLVEMIRKVALQRDIQRIAFSGGVFQNRLLVDLITAKLGQDFHLHFHQELSPNDENIAYGQLAHLAYINQHQLLNQKSIVQCV